MGISLISNPPYNLRHKLPELAGFMPRYTGWTLPPESNANYAFILSALAWIEDRAVILLPNNVLSSGVKEELSLRKQLVNENLLLAVVTLPGGMFESTDIPTCILVFQKKKETRKIAMIDLTDLCGEEIREQRGQYGGASHTGRTYCKTVKVVPAEIMLRCQRCIDEGIEDGGFCKWVSPEQVEEGGYNLIPRRYMEIEVQESHRPFEDIAADYNRVIRQKNMIKIRMNRTAAKRLGYDCMDMERPDIGRSFSVVGQKAEKEDNITFSASDGIQITISTRDGIHPLILDFLNHWKQMIMYLNTEENRLLTEFRDALLPELMSGNVNISDE